MLTNDPTDVLATKLRPVLTRLVRKLRKLSPVDTPLSQSERSVLVLLEQNGELLSAELAVMEKITPQSMGQIINHLSALNLIDKKVSPTDKRKILLSISAQGAKMIQQVRNERDEWLSKALRQTCTPAEQQLLLQAIDSLNKLVDFE